MFLFQKAGTTKIGAPEKLTKEDLLMLVLKGIGLEEEKEHSSIGDGCVIMVFHPFCFSETNLLWARVLTFQLVILHKLSLLFLKQRLLFRLKLHNGYWRFNQCFVDDSNLFCWLSWFSSWSAEVGTYDSSRFSFIC